MTEGMLLKAIRGDMSQENFGLKIGMSQDQISRFECGKQYLKVPEWIFIAKTFKSPVAYLVAMGRAIKESFDNYSNFKFA